MKFWNSKPKLSEDIPVVKPRLPASASTQMLYNSDDLMTRAKKIAWYFSRAAGGSSYVTYTRSPESAALTIFEILETYRKLDVEAAERASRETAP